MSEAVRHDESVRSAGRRVLITGVAGQDGSYLAEQFVAAGATVFGLVRDGQACPAAGVTTIAGDMRDAASLRRALEQSEPHEVYNLAAATSVAGSWAHPDEVLDVNAAGLEHLAVAMQGCASPARLCHASSAEIFGAASGRPQSEDDPLAPTTPYGEAKVRAHRYVEKLRQERGLFACSAILFNHESPRRPPSFVTRKITMAAARIARGLEDRLVLGNLATARDWGYAPEYVDAMRRMLAAGTPRDYVVATGRAITVGRFAELAFARAGLDWTRHVTSDPALLREGDAAARIGDPSRIERDLGWKAATTVEELIAIMVDADLALL